MDFFRLSKLFWFLAQPGNLLVLLLVAALVLERLQRRRAAHVAVTCVTVAMAAILLLPLDQWLARPLEDRFPAPALPPCADGILILGEVELPRISLSRGTPTTGTPGRYAEAAALMRLYPSAKVVFSGGPPEALGGPAPDAETAKLLFADLGIDKQRLSFEEESRNTWENLLYSQRLVQPKPGEVWLMIASALHMPRAMGVARQVGWEVIPVPTDYRTPADGGVPILHWSLAESLVTLDAALKEWVGLAAYRLTGRSAALFPAPGETAAPTVCQHG